MHYSCIDHVQSPHSANIQSHTLQEPIMHCPKGKHSANDVKFGGVEERGEGRNQLATAAGGTRANQLPALTAAQEIG